MVELIWKLSGNLIFHVLLSIKASSNLQTSLLKTTLKVSLSTLSLYNCHTNHSGN